MVERPALGQVGGLDISKTFSGRGVGMDDQEQS